MAIAPIAISREFAPCLRIPRFFSSSIKVATISTAVLYPSETIFLSLLFLGASEAAEKKRLGVHRHLSTRWKNVSGSKREFLKDSLSAFAVAWMYDWRISLNSSSLLL